MNPNDPSTPPQKGLSALAITGIGCAAVLVLGGIAVVAALYLFVGKAKEAVGDFQKNPARAAATLVVKMDPDLELVKTDDATGEMTIRDKKSGEETTMSFDDIAKGKFHMKTGKGDEVTLDGGKVTMKNANGETVLGGDAAATAPPAWVPTYPGATPQPGGVKVEKGATVSGTVISNTSDPVAKVREYYASKLTDEGYTIDIAGDAGTAVVIGNKDSNKRNVTAMIAVEKGVTNVVITYESK